MRIYSEATAIVNRGRGTPSDGMRGLPRENELWSDVDGHCRSYRMLKTCCILRRLHRLRHVGSRRARCPLLAHLSDEEHHDSRHERAQPAENVEGGVAAG